MIGDFGPCDSQDAGEAFDSEGATYQTCEPFLATGSNALDAVTYLPTDLTDGITWK